MASILNSVFVTVEAKGSSFRAEQGIMGYGIYRLQYRVWCWWSPFNWVDFGASVKEAASFLTPVRASLTCCPPTWKNSGWSGCDGQLLQRQHGAFLSASSRAVSQDQSSTTTAANVSLPPAPVGPHWEYPVTIEKLLYHWLEVIYALSNI